MSDDKKFVLGEFGNLDVIKNYYTGNTYKFQGAVYPSITNNIKEAKVYNSQSGAYRGVKALNEKCGGFNFEVIPLDNID